ncbi:MAG TPA: AAA family ATPase, partial [Clostridiales bacterium]|nr:AAA family ATPase [Clostridiales bacterium]
RIQGFRRHWDTEINLSNATFLIGENNTGKSSILLAIDYLLSDKKKIPCDQFFQRSNDEHCNEPLANKIVLTGEFCDLPPESNTWRGFRGRVFPYEVDGHIRYKIYYRKTYEMNKNYTVELREYKRTVKEEFERCNNLQSYIDNGIDEVIIQELFGNADRTRNLSAAQKNLISEIDEIYDIDTDEENWFPNPGGIPRNILSKLPRYLLIPAQDKKDDLSGNSGALVSTLNELFNDVRDNSANFLEAQRYLNQLADELNPNDETTEFGSMMVGLNRILAGIFPETRIHTTAKLCDADKVIQPQFEVNMSSNIQTTVDMQGTGTIRAAVFALLRYKALREESRRLTGTDYIRPLIIGFEEPELYLHPNAAYQMRDTIYKLADSDRNQIICTTHSPYMIDLGQKPNQILNLLSLLPHTLTEPEISIEKVFCNPFNISQAFTNLHDDDKTYIKMLLKVDDYVAKVFFTKDVLIVEGDTEEVVLRETIDRLDNTSKQNIYQNWQIIKARGKASIISLVRFLTAMGINPTVMHDQDTGVEGAEVFNQPILDAVGNPEKVYALTNCIEDILGYNAPSSEKPYKAFKHIKDNWTDINQIPETWMSIFRSIFGIQLNQ